MFDIIVNGQVVAIAAESVVKLFMNALIEALPTEVSVAARAHVDPAPAQPAASQEDPSKVVKK